MRRAALVAVVTALLSAPIASAAADTTVTVPGLAFPDGGTYLTYFGCESLYQGDNQAPQVRIGKDAGAANRSFGILVPGSGTASGPVHTTDSVAGTTVAGFSARPEAATTGAAYVWYVTDDLEPGQVWAGRAGLSVSGGGWQYVDTAAKPYSWQLLDSATGGVVERAGTSTIAGFTRAHGDGPGYMLSGLGCNGQDFSIDKLRFGSAGAATMYDLEGIASTNHIDAKVKDRRVQSGVEVEPGTAVTLIGTADDGTPTAPLGAPMQLRARVGDGPYKNVGKPTSAGVDGSVRAVVEPEVTTTYQWYLPDLGYTGDVYSEELTIIVLPPAGEPPAQEPDDSGTPSEAPSSGAGDGSAEEGAATQQAEPEVPALPSQAPSEEATEEPSGGQTEPPAEEPTADATPPAPEASAPADTAGDATTDSAP